MANIIGLALKVTGDATGLAKSLTPVDRALDRLAQQAEKATAVFQPFADKTAAAAAAQEDFADRFSALSEQLRSGIVAPEEYAAAFGKLTEEAKASAEAFREGLRITAELRTEEERRVEELAKLQGLLEQGAISQETFVRASEKATGVEKERADAAAAAARIIAANLTPQERYDQQLQELAGHLEAGRLNQEQFNRAAEKAKRDLDGVGKEAQKTDKNIESLNKNVRFLATVEIGRLIVDGLRTLGTVFTSVQSQITGLVTQVNSSIDTLNDFSARTGLGVEALQGYSLAAKLAGVDTEQFGAAIQRLSVNIGKAAIGGEFDKALRGINLSVAELIALAPEQQFSAIGNAIAQLPTAADRAAAAVQVFGKQGAALAPLFREGADSLEELRARAERLGIIVDQTQVDNVADMNDGFDLVRATIEGIIGQVVGNLAPAVTDVTNQFLRFVEEWSGAQGQGGTGIANAITDVLLQGAEYFAGIFDQFAGSFTGFSEQLETAANAFDAVAGVLDVLSGVFKTIFNTFQIIGNGIAAALGKVLEAIGSYVSTDLETFGKNLQTEATSQIQANIADLEAAGQQIIDGTTQVIFGNQQEQEAAAAGAAQTYVRGLREQIEQQRAPAFRIQTDIEATRERFESFFNGIVDQSSEITNAMRGFEAAVAAVQDPLNMTEEEIKRIQEAQELVNRTIDQELTARQEMAEATAKQAEADAKRIDELTKASDSQTKLAEDLAAVSREQVRVQEELAAARESGDTQAADAAAARIAQLDQLEAKLSDLQQAIDQGFAEGFQRTFDATAKALDGLIDKAGEFGNAGALASQQLQAGIAAAQQQARDGILTQNAYQAEVARQQELFNQRLGAAQRVEEFLARGVDQRQRAELDAVRQIEERKKAAELNVQALQAKIAEEESKRAGATDLREKRASTQRLNALRQAQRIEEGIAAGRNESARTQISGLSRGFNQVERFQSLVANQNAAFLQSFSNTFGVANASLAAANAAAAELARQQELTRPVAGTVATADIRTAEGAALVLGLGAAAQDPALIEARLQTKQLQGIRQAITNAVTGYLNTPVEIF